MSEMRRRYDPEFKSGVVRIVLETGKPIARVARDLGLHAGTLGNWGEAAACFPGRQRAVGVRTVWLSLFGCATRWRSCGRGRDVLKRSVVLWVKEATR